jgi:hypothetical protein
LALSLGRSRRDCGGGVGAGLLYDDFGEILVVFIVDVDDLHGDGGNFLKGFIEPHRIVRIVPRDRQHLKRLVQFPPPSDSYHQLVGRKAIMEQF